MDAIDSPPLKSPPANRSSEELQMRDALVAWGRARWPDARVLHELQVGGCRIDLAFVTTDQIAGVEIKSSKDVLDRLRVQMRHFTHGLPETWVAIAPKWLPHLRDEDGASALPWSVGKLIVEDGVITTDIPTPTGRHAYPSPARIDPLMTVPLLHLVHKDELIGIAAENGLRVKVKDGRQKLMTLLANELTGRQIRNGVCRALRSRVRGWDGDEPLKEGFVTRVPKPARPQPEFDL